MKSEDTWNPSDQELREMIALNARRLDATFAVDRGDLEHFDRLARFDAADGMAIVDQLRQRVHSLSRAAEESSKPEACS